MEIKYKHLWLYFLLQPRVFVTELHYFLWVRDLQGYVCDIIWNV